MLDSEYDALGLRLHIELHSDVAASDAETLAAEFDIDSINTSNTEAMATMAMQMVVNTSAEAQPHHFLRYFEFVSALLLLATGLTSPFE